MIKKTNQEQILLNRAGKFIEIKKYADYFKAKNRPKTLHWCS